MQTLHWFVAGCIQHAKGTLHAAWRVQRYCQDGQVGAYEMAFVHKDKDLCEEIAGILNRWEEKNGNQSNPEVVPVRPPTPAPEGS